MSRVATSNLRNYKVPLSFDQKQSHPISLVGTICHHFLVSDTMYRKTTDLSQKSQNTPKNFPKWCLRSTSDRRYLNSKCGHTCSLLTNMTCSMNSATTKTVLPNGAVQLCKLYWPNPHHQPTANVCISNALWSGTSDEHSGLSKCSILQETARKWSSSWELNPCLA